LSVSLQGVRPLRGRLSALWKCAPPGWATQRGDLRRERLPRMAYLTYQGPHATEEVTFEEPYREVMQRVDAVLRTGDLLRLRYPRGEFALNPARIIAVYDDHLDDTVTARFV
jgi:hypothetical protein